MAAQDLAVRQHGQTAIRLQLQHSPPPSSILQDLERGDEAIPLQELVKHSYMRLSGRKPAHQFIGFRWAKHGLRAPGGGKVILETIRRGGVKVTTPSALLRFFARLSGEAAAGSPAPSHDERDLLRAEAELERAGI